MDCVIDETDVSGKGSVPVSVSGEGRASIVYMSGGIREHLVVSVSELVGGWGFIDVLGDCDNDETKNECGRKEFNSFVAHF